MDMKVAAAAAVDIADIADVINATDTAYVVILLIAGVMFIAIAYATARE